MKYIIEIDLKEGQGVPTAEDIARLTDPDWMASWWHIDDVVMSDPDRDDDWNNTRTTAKTSTFRQTQSAVCNLTEVPFQIGLSRRPPVDFRVVINKG